MKLTHSLAMLAIPAVALASANLMAQTTTVNPYSPAAGHPYRHGVVPTREVHAKMKSLAPANILALSMATGPQTLSYGGGSVASGTPKVYLVVMGSQWGVSATNPEGNLALSNDPVGAVPYLQQLFKGLGTGGELWSGTMTQYCDGPLVPVGSTSCPSGASHVGYPTGGAFAGIWYDNGAAAPVAATVNQLSQEAINAAAHFGNISTASNRYAQYVILSPTGTNPDGFNTPEGGFCAWHTAVASSYGSIAYTNMPYVYDMSGSCGAQFVNKGTAGSLDGFSIIGGHEYAGTVTDQSPGANGGWFNASTYSPFVGEEDADECAWITTGAQTAVQNVTLGTGTFAMQSTWSNDTNGCSISHVIVNNTPACFGAWNPSTAYGANATVSYNSVNYTAAYWTQGNNPSASSGAAGSGQPWINDGACGAPAPTPWAVGGTYTAGQVVSYNGSTYTALVNQTDAAGTGWNPTVGSLFKLNQ